MNWWTDTTGRRAMQAGACSLLSLAVHAAWLQATAWTPVPLERSSAPPSRTPRTSLSAQHVVLSQSIVVTTASPALRSSTMTPDPSAPATGTPAREVVDHSPSDPGKEEASFLPRSVLTTPPAPLTEVFLPYPPEAPRGRWQTEITLFIDAHGDVRRVQFDGTLPRSLADSVRHAFLSTRYAPGQVQDRPVNARIRLEVAFESDDEVRALQVP